MEYDIYAPCLDARDMVLPADRLAVRKDMGEMLCQMRDYNNCQKNNASDFYFPQFPDGAVYRCRRKYNNHI